MLVAAAVCPCPPLLVPEVAAGAAGELDELRQACAKAVEVLAAARPERLVVLAPVDAEEAGSYPAGSAGRLDGFGVRHRVVLGADDQLPSGTRELPAALTVGAWLLQAASWGAAPVTGVGVDAALPTSDCLARGARLVEGGERVALLVLGDGSARRTLKAPGYLDERAAAFDAAVARALGTADTAALRAVDTTVGAELMAAGRAPWHVLAGAGEDARLRGELLHDSAPYGVGYLVAVWS